MIRLLGLLAALLLAIPFAAQALDSATDSSSASISPAAVQPASISNYTVAILNRQNSDESAQSAQITVPAGFVVDPLTLAATIPGAGACSASTWSATLTVSSIDLAAPDAAGELPPGCPLNVTFTAVAPVGEGTFTWTSTLSRGATQFNVQGTQPRVIVDGTPPADPAITEQPLDPTNDTTPMFSFSDSDGSATFRCQLDGGGFSVCTSPKTYSAQVDGPHSFDVKAIDSAGNESGVTSFSWTIDTVAPPAPTITSAPPNPDTDSSPTFEFSDSEAGVTFRCELDGGAFATCTSPKTYGSQADGSHTFTVEAVDAAGNTASATYTWTIDTTPPPVPTITSKPTNPSNNTSPTFEFTDSEAGVSFECKLDPGGVYAACTSPKAYSGLTGNPNTNYTFRVRAVDATQHKSNAATYSWTVDTDPPGVTLDSTPSDLSNDSTPTFAFHADETSTFICRLDAQAFAACSSPKTLPATPDGLHTFTVRATDAAGNTGQASRAWTIDATAPKVTLTQKPQSPSDDSTPTFDFSADEPAPTGFQCKLDSGSFAACTGPTTLSPTLDGSHTFTVRATDAAGNTGVTSYTWTIDTVNPVVTILSKPPDPTNQTTATFTFSSNKVGSTFQCKRDALSFVPCTSPLSYNSLDPGDHTFSVKASDGLHSGLPTTYTWKIDVTPPPAPSIAGGPGNPTNGTSASFVFSDSEGGLSFGCQLDGGVFSPCSSPAAYSGLADGAHTFAVQATDAAGNTGPAASYGWLVDTVAPDTTITTKPTAVSSSASATFGFTSSEPGSSFACSLDGGALASCSSPQTYAALADGTHTFRVGAADAAGNADSTPASYSWQVATLTPPDRTPPGTIRGLKRKVGYRLLKLVWSLPRDSDFDHVRVLMSRSSKKPARTVVYNGKRASYANKRFQNGSYYRYAVVSYDHFGNASRSVSVVVPPSMLLRSPRNGAAVKAPPVLAWTRVAGASFYNVQLYTVRGKVLSAWPNLPKLGLKRSWVYAGHHFQLKKGLYQWFVWPGFGSRAKGHYGQLLGQGTFRVR